MPVPVQYGRASRTDDEGMSLRQQLYRFVGCRRAPRRRTIRDKAQQGHLVKCAGYGRVGEDALDRVTDDQGAWGLSHVEHADANAIPRADQRAFTFVPSGECVLATQVAGAVERPPVE